ncbi:MAG: hypothetical protein GWO10_08190, partial [candidate division Zixibacteria bacterium]|nr:hypothetical protein [Phycisphaerae bacterium]NIR63739.1 hypothetical protein [candidate division Zixibacteria bacterium]
DYRNGYINVDIIEGKGDVTADIANLPDDFFEEGSVREFVVRDVLDHITYVQGKRFLRQCYRWLQENGTIEIHTPNLRNLARMIATQDNHEAVVWLYSTDGQGSTYYPSNFSKWGYTETALTEELENIGFIIIKMHDDCLGYGLLCLAVKR